ncbi:glycerol dehydrogenase [Tepidibacillus decaturensis]|uniref:Glycerol dehydrogenase n=1 Tax=Tepidibacillus decaturensis TaxID=1413211 RepID=A0A135L130_9BACI|nr:glycerol dehydrogenase [Tepidibacillus decaturensis]KXG42706.1 glycerol dehydrogenase [Tepidibacillus decaturensis]
MSTKIIISPGKYIQGNGELAHIENYTKNYGRKPFIIADEFVTGLTKDIVDKSYKANNAEYVMELFKGECSKVEINRLKALAEEKGCDMVVGIGGGKTLDTAKAIAFYIGCPVIVVPTIASTDAPCSALAVLYTEEGTFDEYLLLPTNPSVVLIDTQIIAAAPVRLLVAGMGDALATYFEARACKRSNAVTMAGGNVTEGAFALAELCYKTLISDGLKAKLVAESKISNSSVEKIIEANIYLSGIGFESGGLAAAHAIHNGLTVLEECHHLYHGEKVAFGTLTQLVLENAPMEEIKEVIEFCKSVGLPTTLEDMGAQNVTEEQLRKVAEASVAEGETIHNMPFNVTADDVYAAILTADKLGKYFK